MASLKFPLEYKKRVVWSQLLSQLLQRLTTTASTRETNTPNNIPAIREIRVTKSPAEQTLLAPTLFLDS